MKETEEATQQQKEQDQQPPAQLQQRSVLSADPNWSIDTFNVQDDTELFEEALIPPENFNMVCEHVYRSSFPKKKHYKFLEKLKLKSVLQV
jgi:tyrosine-protein phosphatase SIW14